MSFASDIFLGAGTIGVIVWCVILARRIGNINDLDKGVGGAIVVLSQQVDDMTRALAAAQSAATQSGTSIREVTERAESVSQRLELLIAALHDLPEEDRRGLPKQHAKGSEPLNLAFARVDEPRLPEFLSARRGRA